MAELHKFRDDVRTQEDRAKPIGARHLDENFKTVRLKIGSSLQAVFRIKETAASNDELEISSSAPTSGTWIFGIVDGTPQWIETEEC